MSASQSNWTPPQLAEYWQCSADHIITLINSRELPAFNSAPKTSARKKYHIRDEDRVAFEEARAVDPIPPMSQLRRKRLKQTDVIEFFK
jgi:hypothetical protein